MILTLDGKMRKKIMTFIHSFIHDLSIYGWVNNKGGIR